MPTGQQYRTSHGGPVARQILFLLAAQITRHDHADAPPRHAQSQCRIIGARHFHFRRRPQYFPPQAARPVAAIAALQTPHRNAGGSGLRQNAVHQRRRPNGLRQPKFGHGQLRHHGLGCADMLRIGVRQNQRLQTVHALAAQGAHQIIGAECRARVHQISCAAGLHQRGIARPHIQHNQPAPLLLPHPPPRGQQGQRQPAQQHRAPHAPRHDGHHNQKAIPRRHAPQRRRPHEPVPTGNGGRPLDALGQKQRHRQGGMIEDPGHHGAHRREQQAQYARQQNDERGWNDQQIHDQRHRRNQIKEVQRQWRGGDPSAERHVECPHTVEGGCAPAPLGRWFFAGQLPRIAPEPAVHGAVQHRGNRQQAGHRREGEQETEVTQLRRRE